MRLLLVYPSGDTLGFSESVAMLEPLGLEYLAAAISKHEVQILDLRVEKSLADAISAWEPDVVGITGFTHHAPKVISLSKEVKAISQEIKVVVGGHHATFMPESFMIPSIDAVARGECESIIEPILDSIGSPEALSKIPGLIYRNKSEWSSNNGWPSSIFQSLVARHNMVDASHYHALGITCSLMLATRGCPYQCNFCDARKFYRGKYQVREVDKVVEEVRMLPTKLVGMLDENIGINRHYLESLVSALTECGIKKRYITTIGVREILKNMALLDRWFDIGLRALFIGLERVDDEGIARLGKRCTVSMNNAAVSYIHSRGGIVMGSFIVLPTDTEDDFKRLEEYIRSHQIDIPIICILTPFPGTDLWVECPVKSDDFSQYDILHAVIPTSLPEASFYRHFHYLYTTVNLQRLVWKMVKSMGVGGWLLRLPRVRTGVKRIT